jgi:hypothetical protein
MVEHLRGRGELILIPLEFFVDPGVVSRCRGIGRDMLYPNFATASIDFRRVASRSLTMHSEGSGRLGPVEISRRRYRFLSFDRADLVRRIRTIPASYRLKIRDDHWTAVLRLYHRLTAIAVEARVVSSDAPVRRIKSNARN